jgi:hypothetical protein
MRWNIPAYGDSMKTFAFVVMVLFVLLSSLAGAENFHKNLVLSPILVLADEQVLTRVTLDNQMSRVFDDGLVAVTIPSLDVRSSHRIRKAYSHVTANVLLDIPEAAKGEYYVRIVVNDDGVRRIRHRLFTIE